jgi:hypothetical protein
MTSSPDDVHATGMTYAELVLMTGSHDTVHSTIPAIVDAKTTKINACDQPMCLTTTHVYKSAGNCSQITRHIMEQALESN